MSLCARPASRVPPWWRVRWCPLVASRGAGVPFATKRAACPRCFVPPVPRPVWRGAFSAAGVLCTCGAPRVARVRPFAPRVALCGGGAGVPLPRVPWWWTWRACPVLVSRGGASRAAGGLYKAKDKNGAPAVRWCVFGGCQRAPAVAGFVSRGGIEPPPAHQRGTKGRARRPVWLMHPRWRALSLSAARCVHQRRRRHLRRRLFFPPGRRGRRQVWRRGRRRYIRTNGRRRRVRDAP